MSEDVKPRQFWIDDITQRICAPWYHPELGVHTLYWPDNEKVFHVIELEPTLQLMKEMGEALKNIPDDEIIDNRDYFISGNANEALEKYSKFLEGIEK